MLVLAKVTNYPRRLRTIYIFVCKRSAYFEPFLGLRRSRGVPEVPTYGTMAVHGEEGVRKERLLLKRYGRSSPTLAEKRRTAWRSDVGLDHGATPNQTSGKEMMEVGEFA